MANMQNKPDELKLDTTLEAMIQRANDIKQSINQFLFKLDHEYETLSPPSVLDSFALLSSQINSFHKLLANDRTAPLKSYVFVPIQLNPDRDIELEKLTEGRVPSFNHETVPNYLRTKPELDVEKNIKSHHSEKFSNMTPEQLSKTIATFNKLLTTVLNTISTKREEWKNEESSRRIPESSSRNDTLALVAATAKGKGLVDHRLPPPQTMQMHPGQVPAPMRHEMHPGMMHPRAPIPTINMGGPGPMRGMRPNIRMNPYYNR